MSDPRTSTFERYQGSPPEIYERHFVPTIGVPSATLVLDAAGLRTGERVLDVACGTGVAARLAAEQVGPTARLAGVDVNPGMLAVARTAAPVGRTVEWYEGTAEALPLAEAEFDVVLCSIGLQFFTDKVSALQEMGRVLVPGGRVALGTPGPTPPPFEVLHEVLAEHVGPEAAGFVDVVFSLSDAQEMRDLLDAAGFVEIDVQRTTLPLRLPPPADFLWQYVQGTPLALAVTGMDDGARAALERDAVRRWARFVEDGALVATVGMLVATAGRARKDPP